ncbi:MAG: cyanophycinase-like exopeptidase, partial [Bacteroidia bacterium]
FHTLDGRHFIAHQADNVGFWSDKNKTAVFDLFSKIRVLGEKALAGVNANSVGNFSGGNNRRAIEIAFGRGGGADADRLVGEANVHQVLVGLGVHGHGLDA